MTRVRGGKVVMRSRKRLRRLTKGFRLSRRTLVRQSTVTLIRSRVYAFRDRRVRKRMFRRLWITRLSAACRMRGMRYSEFIYGLAQANVQLDRKVLADIAVHDPDAFTQLAELARANLPGAAKSA
jgi:large subunit ribosomal protein L20